MVCQAETLTYRAFAERASRPSTAPFSGTLSNLLAFREKIVLRARAVEWGVRIPLKTMEIIFLLKRTGDGRLCLFPLI